MGSLVTPCFGETNFTVIKSFGYPENSGNAPEGGLIEGSDGMLYGVTALGGSSPASTFYVSAGTVFKIQKDGTGFLVLHHFSRTDGAEPRRRLIEASDGNLYGTTRIGGLRDGGTVFRLAKDGKNFETIHHFAGPPNDGFEPSQGIVETRDGSLYGSTIYSGTNGGTIYRLNKDGSGYSIIHKFQAYPSNPGPLLQGSDDQIYGTASGGNLGNGSIFRMTTEGTVSVVYTFSNPDCSLPALSLETDDGFLYGTTSSLDTTNAGCIFKIKKDGTEMTILKNFIRAGVDGEWPLDMIEGFDGNIYGNTREGGTSTSEGVSVRNRGTVFRIGKDGQNFSVLHEFTSDPDGILPRGGVIQGADGTLYGTSIRGGGSSFGAGTGIVYKIGTNGSDYKVIHSFDYTGGDGHTPIKLIRGGGQTLYGTTQAGGAANSFGTIFELHRDGSGYHQIVGFTNHLVQGDWPSWIAKGTDGYLYGLTKQGGEKEGGIIFKTATNGTVYRVLHSLDPMAEGSDAQTLVVGTDQRLYGTTSLNGPLGAGTVFGLNSDGSGFSILRSFGGASGDEGSPGLLIEGLTGELYGAATYSIFRLSKDGAHYELLHDFHTLPGDGRTPVAIIQTYDGTLFGMTAVGGTYSRGIIFRMSPTGSNYRILYHFQNYQAPQGLIEGTDGFLYGSTYSGGSLNSGTVFRIGKDGSNYSVVYDFSPINRGPRTVAGIVEGGDGALYVPTMYGGQMSFGTVCRLVPQPQISELRMLSNQRTRVVVLALSGQQIRVEGSTDLLNWALVGSATSVDGNIVLDDPNLTGLRYQFYRALVE